ncbi:Transposon Ty3-G Gag-Pol poly [Brachionus plicatilis]|uniref:Transposon Ty3-G Gag-Pol poly n=1 Tax=Brachionus plicatilis TaxID=10195 RepID=A0A3M7RPF4_BRAPC|nr:Transposon Ty3-G Gag-Pol poly [Brachionus plicatilis]
MMVIVKVMAVMMIMVKAMAQKVTERSRRSSYKKNTQRSSSGTRVNQHKNDGKKTRQQEYDNNRELNMSTITEKSIIETLAASNIASKILNAFGWNKQTQNSISYQQTLNQYHQWMLMQQQFNRINQNMQSNHAREIDPATDQEDKSDPKTFTKTQDNQELRNRGEYAHAHVYLHTFVGRVQELNESLDQYAAVLQELGRKAFPDLNLRELDIYLRGQFLAGVQILVLRAREHEGLPFGFSRIRERSRNMFNQGTGRHITEGKIRNLITPKLESNLMFQNQNKHYGNSQNNVETISNSYDNGFVNANLSNMSNYSKLLNNSNDGSYLNSTIRNYVPNYPVQKPAMRCFLCNQEGHIKRNCPNRIRNMNNQYYRLGYDSQYSSLNRSTPIVTIRNDQRNQFSANTNNINEESDNDDLKYVFGYLNGEKIECLLDTGSSFTTANGQPLNVGSYTASLRIGTNEVKLDVFVAVDLQHDCLIGLDYMGKVQGTRDKLKEIYSSLGGEEVVKDRKNKAVNRVEFSKEEQKRIDSFLSENEDIFAKSREELGCCNFTMHQIDIQGSEPIRESARRIPHHLKIEIKKQLDELVETT